MYIVKNNQGYILEGQTVQELFERILTELTVSVNFSGVVK